jgi:hypothetical protein
MPVVEDVRLPRFIRVLILLSDFQAPEVHGSAILRHTERHLLIGSDRPDVPGSEGSRANISSETFEAYQMPANLLRASGNLYTARWTGRSLPKP